MRNTVKHRTARRLSHNSYKFSPCPISYAPEFLDSSLDQVLDKTIIIIRLPLLRRLASNKTSVADEWILCFFTLVEHDFSGAEDIGYTQEHAFRQVMW